MGGSPGGSGGSPLEARPTSAPGWNLRVPGPQAQNQKKRNALNRPNSRDPPGILRGIRGIPPRDPWVASFKSSIFQSQIPSNPFKSFKPAAPQRPFLGLRVRRAEPRPWLADSDLWGPGGLTARARIYQFYCRWEDSAPNLPPGGEFGKSRF